MAPRKQPPQRIRSLARGLRHCARGRKSISLILCYRKMRITTHGTRRRKRGRKPKRSMGALVAMPVGSASAAYLFSYYLGSSVFGTTAGTAWQFGGWGAVGWMNLALLVVCLTVAILIRLRAREPAQLLS